jgi:hypothetical protein
MPLYTNEPGEVDSVFALKPTAIDCYASADTFVPTAAACEVADALWPTAIEFVYTSSAYTLSVDICI